MRFLKLSALIALATLVLVPFFFAADAQAAGSVRLVADLVGMDVNGAMPEGMATFRGKGGISSASARENKREFDNRFDRFLGERFKDRLEDRRAFRDLGDRFFNDRFFEERSSDARAFRFRVNPFFRNPFFFNRFQERLAFRAFLDEFFEDRFAGLEDFEDSSSSTGGRYRLELQVGEVDLGDGISLMVFAGGKSVGSIMLKDREGELKLDSAKGDMVPILKAGDMIDVVYGQIVVLSGILMEK